MSVASACPQCGRKQHRENPRCLTCGVDLFLSDDVLSAPALSREARKALGLGFLIALVLWWIPFTEILFFPLVTIVHELGHTLTAWMFGYPSIPAFDFAEGGGVTSTLDRVPLLLVVPYSCLALASWKVRHHRPTLIGLAGLVATYSWLAFTDWHNALITAMGHGTELIIAMVFLFRAMSGTALLQVDERPAYALAGFLIWLHDMQFALGLIRDPEMRAWYGEGKRDISNDLTVLGEEYLHMPVPRIAKLFVVTLVVGLVIPRLIYRYESPIALWWMRASEPTGG